ncbi:hypothetical protein AYO44_13870 [Planctomycetaceae bacterium SCGC AG-212-F19]|nr:hypothetical protein AYO44_13870 [Planctomycetaceae bacterium SCGC AG-212-F19]
MDEATWLATDHIGGLWQFLKAAKHNPGARKLRLFACACCRRGWAAFTDTSARQGVEVAERAADRLASRKELNAAAQAARVDVLRRGQMRPDDPEYNRARACGAAAQAAAPKSYNWGEAWRAAATAAGAVAGLTGSMYDPAFNAAVAAENRAQAVLFRHLIGNPYRPFAAPEQWPATVVQLTESLYGGQDCRLPLSDALEEAGFADLARHFREEDWHPKGCWAMDAILGKG